MKVVLITGTSTGIGLEIAAQAARAGYQVVATMRDLGKSAALREAAPDADVRQLDVIDDDSVATCVAGVIADHGRLDAVVNNAGAGHFGTIELETVDDIRKVMEVNFFGVVRVTKAVMPHLRTTRGRLLTVTSVGGVVGRPFSEAYCAAKFAVEGWMESLALVVGRLGVGVSVVEPGPVASEFVANVLAGTDVDAVFANGGDYVPIINEYMAQVGKAFENAQTSENAAAAVVAALSDEQPKFRYQTSEHAERFVGLKLADLDGSAVQAAPLS